MHTIRLMILVVTGLMPATVFAQSPAPPAAPGAPSMIPGAPPPVLAEILNAVRQAYNRQERPMVIFDIDGTLMDNRPRIAAIVKEYAEVELKGVRPADYKKLRAVTTGHIQYQLTETLKAIGVVDPAVVNNAAVFWSKKFFTDGYLEHDMPTSGSVQFVRKLYSNGARIVYVSGRDVPRQLLGTVKSLRKQGYPIGIQGTELILKPTRQTQDAVFKQQVTNYLRHYGKVIAAFDNEPANVNVYRRAFADAKVVLYHAPHSPNPPKLLPKIIRIMRF